MDQTLVSGTGATPVVCFRVLVVYNNQELACCSVTVTRLSSNVWA
jgi:hypothetical protein